MRRFQKTLYFICILGYNLLNVYFAKIIMNISDSLSYESSDIFFRYLKIGIVAITSLVVLNFLSIILQNYIVRNEMQDAQMKSFGCIFSEEKRALKEDDYNSKFAFLTKEMDLYESNYVMRKLSMLSSLILFSASSLMIFSINQKLLLIILVLVLLMVIVPFVMNKTLREANERYLHTNEELYAKTGEFLQGFETVKTFFAETEIVKNYEKYVLSNNEKKRILSNKLGFTNALTAFLGVVIVFVTFVAGGIMVFNHEITIGAIFATVQLVTNMITPLTELLYGISEMNSVRDIINRIQKSLKQVINYKEYKPLENRTHALTLKNVSFVYDKQKSCVLADLSMNFEQGKMYAIVGENGTGKSTIGKLIAGYNAKYSGEIMLDENELRTIEPSELRKHIAYINQNPFVFDSSAYDNCTFFGKYPIAQENIKTFECEHMISNDEKSAITLSGGEKQKLVFLRSLNLDFDIIIYDEAEASMDIIARKKLLEFLKNQKNKIVICISHSIDESLGLFDQVIYLKKGGLIEQGNFQQLYDNHGDFFSFYNKKIS